MLQNLSYAAVAIGALTRIKEKKQESYTHGNLMIFMKQAFGLCRPTAKSKFQSIQNKAFSVSHTMATNPSPC